MTERPLIDVLPEALEIRAGAMWRDENPEMSAFACDAEMKRNCTL